jgi:hypothetical protein
MENLRKMLWVVLLLMIIPVACKDPDNAAPVPDPGKHETASSFKTFEFTEPVQKLAFAMVDSLKREMVFAYGDKDRNGQLEKLTNLIYYNQKENMFMDIKISDEHLISEVVLRGESVLATMKFDQYDLNKGTVYFSLIDPLTKQAHIARQQITLPDNVLREIAKAQKAGGQMYQGGRIAANNCDEISNSIRVFSSILGCMMTYPATFALIETALAAAPATAGFSAAIAIFAGAGLLISCKSASENANDYVAGKCAAPSDVPLSVESCLLNIIPGIITRQFPDLRGCALSAADFLLDIADNRPETAQNPTGASTGDPHITTADNLTFDFHGHGEFIAIKSESDNFEVQVRQEDVKNTGYITLNTAIAIQTGEDIVCIAADPNKLYINNKETSLDFGRMNLKSNAYLTKIRDGYLDAVDVVTKNGDRVRVRFHGGYLIDYILYLKENRKGKVSGILGNFDGNPENDIRDAKGRVLKNEFAELYPAYANSWRIVAQKSLFLYAPGKTTASYTKTDFPRTTPYLSVDAMQKAESTCRKAGVNTEPHLNNCIMDVALLNDASLVNSSLWAQQIDPTPEPSETKFIADQFYTATYKVEGHELILTFSGNDLLYSLIYVDVNVNHKVDPQLDKAFATGIYDDGRLAFCASIFESENGLSASCGTVSSSGTLDISGKKQVYRIPFDELDPSGKRQQIAISVSMVDSGKKDWKRYPVFTTTQNVFAKTLLLTIR